MNVRIHWTLLYSLAEHVRDYRPNTLFEILRGGIAQHDLNKDDSEVELHFSDDNEGVRLLNQLKLAMGSLRRRMITLEQEISQHI